MQNVKIIDDKIIYTSSFQSSDKDFSFSLSVNDIIVIGCCNVLSGDDDALFLLFVDHHKKIFPINLFMVIDYEREILISFLKQRYNINIIEMEKKVVNDNIVLFPIELKNEKLFQKEKFINLRRIFSINHEAISGDLSRKVSLYIEKNYEK